MTKETKTIFRQILISILLLFIIELISYIFINPNVAVWYIYAGWVVGYISRYI